MDSVIQFLEVGLLYGIVTGLSMSFIALVPIIIMGIKHKIDMALGLYGPRDI
jgi:hypothetical protein